MLEAKQSYSTLLRPRFNRQLPARQAGDVAGFVTSFDCKCP